MTALETLLWYLDRENVLAACLRAVAAAAIAERESGAFVADRTRVRDGLGTHLLRQPLSGDDEGKLKRIADVAFQRAYTYSQDPVLARDIADDMVLIGSAAATGFDDPWLVALWQGYLDGRLPSGALPVAAGRLLDLL